MNKSNILVGFVLLCYVLSVIFEFSGYETVAYFLHSLIVPLITLIYVLFAKRKSRLFLLFLISYTLSELMGLAIDNMPYEGTQKLYDFQYYFGNLLYILSYLFLVILISKSLSFGHVIKNFKIYILALTALSVYFIYVLQEVISRDLIVESDYYFELIYNIVTILLLPLSLLNYFYKDNKKALYLFIGSLFIVFSEVMDVAHIYITEMSVLNFLSTTFALLAFYFYYQQSKLTNIATQQQFKFVD
ncbi:hypothetical protein [Flavisericum labens]|uniref:hypothetical protein n=1 Tax=Flavisericum labens TaxID=3377112 RepID=UPI00387B214B